MTERLKSLFPITSARLPERFWSELHRANVTGVLPEYFPEQVRYFVDQNDVDGFLPDLAQVELVRHRQRHRTSNGELKVEVLQVNPSLELVSVDWLPLFALLDGGTEEPEPVAGVLVFWRHPVSGKLCEAVAEAADLLALKVVSEQLDPLEIAAESGRPVGVIDGAMVKAVRKGLLLSPPSTLRRDADFPAVEGTAERFLSAEVFTLQWHITHRCDLHCRHCYDRSRRDDVKLSQGLEVLDQLRAFCLRHHVGGQVSFSGGNPFMHPQFFQLYQAAHDRNLNLAILGNPISEAQLDAALVIARPAFYQVSLEGLQEHNDLIRGRGNFAAVFAFLDLLKRKKIYSMVMLTLTRANLDQVLPLAELLRDRVDLFTYSRLAMVGEGAALESPHPEEYRIFVQQYLAAKKSNPALALKDSLINIEYEAQQQQVFGGCTGFGCGAAFNFVSLLPDGQVHACRKFPSPIGDINRQLLEEIYSSPAARAYRRGCLDCDDCRLRAVCGGCLAVAYGWGVDPLVEKDPGCFLAKGNG